jgi:ABC-2 type transport system permease protein
MLFAIIRKELREIFRDRVVTLGLLLFVVVLAYSCFAFTAAWAERNALQSSRQNESREQWLAQTTASAHQATHNGQSVYKRPTRLAAIDPGTDLVLGQTLRLESHKRHEPVGVVRRDQLSFFRLSFESPSLLIQALLPLAAILLSYGVVSRERELGTWNLVTTLGVKRHTVVLGKLVAVFVIVAVMMLPVLIFLTWTVATASTNALLPIGDLVARAVFLAVVNLIYLFGWCATGVALSSRFSVGSTLVLLISCWVFWTLVIPRVAVDLAYSQHPIPSRAKMQEARETAIRHGSDSKQSLKNFNRQLEQRLLKQYDVNDLADLPIDINAARLLAMEEFTDAIDDEALSTRAAIYQKQNRVVDRFGTVSPYLAIRSLSMAFAGTDRQHHEAFLSSAERYRREYVKILNTAEMTREGPGKTPESAREFWGQVPEFQQRSPKWTLIARALKWHFGLLISWSLIMTAIALCPTRGAAT